MTLPFQGRYHELLSNVKYAAVSLTKVHREVCFAISERTETSIPIGHVTNFAGGERHYNVPKFPDVLLFDRGHRPYDRDLLATETCDIVIS